MRKHYNKHKIIVTVQYLHSYESKSIKNRLRRWDFDLYVSGFWHVHAKTPRALTWKGLSLSAQFAWVADRWMINNDRYFDESNGRFVSFNQSKRLLNRWKKPGDITDIPRHGVYTEFDDRLLEDASFLRLKNLTCPE